MPLTDSLKALGIETATSLQGSARRLCMARTVTALGPGGPRGAARAWAWSRVPIRTGLRALARGVTGLDAFALRGRQRADAPRPPGLADLQALGESPSQPAPQGRPPRLSPRLRAAAVRRHLSAHHGATDEALPTVQPRTAQLNALGSYPQQGAKRQPPKKSQTPRPSARR